MPLQQKQPHLLRPMTCCRSDDEAGSLNLTVQAGACPECIYWHLLRLEMA